jgi:hypothetical protein
MKVEQLIEYLAGGKLQYTRENLTQYLSVLHKSHMT